MNYKLKVNKKWDPTDMEHEMTFCNRNYHHGQSRIIRKIKGKIRDGSAIIDFLNLMLVSLIKDKIPNYLFYILFSHL